MFDFMWSQRMGCIGSFDNPCPKCKSVGSKIIQFKTGDMAKYTCDCGHKWFKQWAVHTKENEKMKKI
jgi:hypothetical protein